MDRGRCSEAGRCAVSCMALFDQVKRTTVAYCGDLNANCQPMKVNIPTCAIKFSAPFLSVSLSPAPHTVAPGWHGRVTASLSQYADKLQETCKMDICLPIASLLAFLLYVNTIPADFAYDDRLVQLFIYNVSCL